MTVPNVRSLLYRHAGPFALFCAVVPSARPALNINVETVQKSVVFLYGADGTGQVDPQKAEGTGFFLRVPLTSDPKRSYILLATARHIVDPRWAGCAEANPTVIFARVNKRAPAGAASDQGTAFIGFPLVQNGQSVWTHPSESYADAAVMVLQSPDTALKDVDAETIPISDFPTDDEIKAIGVGDQVVSAGLVPGLAGSNRNRPFFKFGYVSSTSDEDVPTRCSPTASPYNVRGWFLAANLVAGNSGSPVFFVPPGGPGITFGSAVRRPVLLGVQSSSVVPADLAVMTRSADLFEAIQLLKLSDADLKTGQQPAAQQQK